MKVCDRLLFISMHMLLHPFHSMLTPSTRACFQALKDYEIMHRNSTSTENPEDVFQKAGTHSKYKYVYAYMGSSGFGNRLLNLVSSFLLALITNRVLVIYSPDYDIREVCFHVINFDVIYEYCMYVLLLFAVYYVFKIVMFILRWLVGSYSSLFS